MSFETVSIVTAIKRLEGTPGVHLNPRGAPEHVCAKFLQADKPRWEYIGHVHRYTNNPMTFALINDPALDTPKMREHVEMLVRLRWGGDDVA